MTIVIRVPFATFDPVGRDWLFTNGARFGPTVFHLSPRLWSIEIAWAFVRFFRFGTVTRTPMTSVRL